MFHDRNTALESRPEAQTTENDIEDVRYDENARTDLRQTSIGKDPDPEVGQRPETLNPFTKSGSHARKTRIT